MNLALSIFGFYIKIEIRQEDCEEIYYSDYSSSFSREFFYRYRQRDALSYYADVSHQYRFFRRLIGILEGFAEAIAGLSKGYFGHLSDTIGKRKPFVQLGYSLSAVSKPMMAVMTFPFWIFGARTIDRLGKGIRTGARDAMLSSETTQEFKGRVFGFHRAFDTLGAALGPLAALVFLMYISWAI